MKKDVKIADWWKQNHPDDYQQEIIDPNITFGEMKQAFDGTNVYDLVGLVDTFVANEIIEICERV